LGSFKSHAHSFCFFPFAMEITLFAFWLLFLYSFHASVDFSFPSFFFSLTASASSSFHHHVSLCLHGPFHNPHVSCPVSIIIFFICCQCYLHQNISTLLPLPYFDHALVFFTCFFSLSFHCTLGSNFLRHLFVVLNRMFITNNLCFGTHSSDLHWCQYLRLRILYQLLDSRNLYKQTQPFIPLNFLCNHFWQLVHCIELLPAPLPQTPHGHLTAFWVTSSHSPLIMSLALLIFNLVPLFSMLSFCSVCLLIRSSFVSAIKSSQVAFNKNVASIHLYNKNVRIRINNTNK